MKQNKKRKDRKRLCSIVFLASLIIALVSTLPFNLNFTPQIKQAQATELFSDGFESGDLSAYDGKTETGGTIEADTNNPAFGVYNANVSITGTGTRRAYVYKSGFDTDTMYVREYVYFRDELADTSDDTIQVMYMHNNADTSPLCQMGIRETEDWGGSYRVGTTWQSWFNTTTPLALNTWYYIEMGYHVHASEGWFRAYVNGTLIFEVTGIDTDDYGNIGEIRCGVYQSTLSGDPSHSVDIDAIVVADSYIGEAQEGGEGALKSEIVGFSTATNGTSCTFRVKWNATGSHYIFGTNNTGSWQNETAQAFSGTWTNTTKTLHASPDIVVQWRYWVNDTNGDWTSIPIQNLTTTSLYSVGAVTGSASDIQDAVDDVGSQGGGNVYIPEGIFDWYNDQVSFSYDNITIIGAGIDITYINQTKSNPFTQMFYIQNCENVTITGFTLKGLVVGSDSDHTASSGIYLRNVIDFRVHHVKTLDFPDVGIYVRSSNVAYPCRGVIDHCTIDNPYKDTEGGAWAYGVSVKSDSYQPENWDSEITHFLGKYETANDTHPILYVENSFFNRCRHAIVGHQLGWYVFRYNTVEQGCNGNSMIDIHGGDGDVPSVGGRGCEVYGNTLDHLNTSGYGVYLRGGAGVIYNNTIKNTDGGVYLSLDDANDPRPLCDTWIWNNTFLNVGTNFWANPSYFTEDVDYFLREPTMEQDGFTYTPYTYPHPLAGGEPDNTVTLNQPSDDATLNYLNVYFNYTATFYQGSIANSSLWLNISGTWQRVTWNTTAITSGTMHTINYTFSTNGTYIWNIEVFNSTTNHFAPSNFTLTIDTSNNGDSETSSSSSGFSTQTVIFKVYLHGQPVEGCVITVYEAVYDIYEGTVKTRADGTTDDLNLALGQYRYVAEYNEYHVEGEFFHDDYQTVEIHLDEGSSSIRPRFSTVLIFTAFFFMIVVVVAYGISKLPK